MQNTDIFLVKVGNWKFYCSKAELRSTGALSWGIFPWEKWTVFLHPDQRGIVERDYAGPARVSGSAGTGKTIVALHRAAHLARTHPNGRVLLTTFSDTLANALRALQPQKRHLFTGGFVIAITGDRAMVPKSFCFMLAGLLVVVPLWILMSYGITADGRLSSRKIIVGMTFCFGVGVFWLYEDLKDLLRTR